MARNLRLTPYDEPIDEAFDESAAVSDYRPYGSPPSTAMEDYAASDYSGPEEPMPLFLSGEPEAPRRRGFGTGIAAYQDRPAVWPRIFKAAIFTTLAAAIAFAVASMDNPLALFANAKASLPSTSAGPSDAAALTPADQAAAAYSAPRVVTSAQPSPPTSQSSASVMPTRDEIAAALRVARQGPAEIAQPKAAAPAVKRLAADELANLLKRAKALIAVGDIAPARLLLERAADAQEGSAALLLAQTYDPTVLGKQDMRSVTADPAMARAWYQKAAQLGSPDAQHIIQSQK
jgi:hypothetical protein